jgi:hypothetical protein
VFRWLEAHTDSGAAKSQDQQILLFNREIFLEDHGQIFLAS